HGRADRDAGQRIGAVAAGDDVVDETDQAGGQMAGDQRRGQHGGGTHFTAEARRRGVRRHGSRGTRLRPAAIECRALAPGRRRPVSYPPIPAAAMDAGGMSPAPQRGTVTGEGGVARYAARGPEDASDTPQHRSTTPMSTSHEQPAAMPVPAARADCANCGAPLFGEHCHACGQPVKGLVRHFSSLVGDVLDSVFDWDARTPRTLWPLLARPGYLTLEYFAGRRIRYVSPFRLFFFIAVLTFFIGKLTLSFGNENPVQLGGDTGIETALDIAQVEQARDRALARIAASRAELEGQPGAAVGVGQRTADAALGGAEAAIRAQAEERIAAFRHAEATNGPPPVPRLNRLQFSGSEPWDAETNPVHIASLPGFANDWINRQIGRLQKNIPRLQEDP